MRVEASDIRDVSSVFKSLNQCLSSEIVKGDDDDDDDCCDFHDFFNLRICISNALGHNYNVNTSTFLFGGRGRGMSLCDIEKHLWIRLQFTNDVWEIRVISGTK